MTMTTNSTMMVTMMCMRPHLAVGYSRRLLTNTQQQSISEEGHGDEFASGTAGGGDGAAARRRRERYVNNTAMVSACINDERRTPASHALQLHYTRQHDYARHSIRPTGEFCTLKISSRLIDPALVFSRHSSLTVVLYALL